MRALYYHPETADIATIKNHDSIRITPLELAAIDHIATHQIPWTITWIAAEDTHYLTVTLTPTTHVGFPLGHHYHPCNHTDQETPIFRYLTTSTYTAPDGGNTVEYSPTTDTITIEDFLHAQH